MKPVLYPTCESAWRSIIAEVAHEGEPYTDQEGRPCKEHRNVTFTIQDTADATALVERIRHGLPWLYPTTEELRSVFFSIGSVASGYSYAPRIFGDINQVDEFVVPLLKNTPESRRAVIVPYDPTRDSRLDSRDIPSVLSVHLRRNDDGVSMSVMLRSVDVFIGLPANLYQLRCLHEHVAHQLGVPCTELTVFCASVHWLPDYTAAAKHLGADVPRA